MLLNGRGQRRSKASKSSLGNHADGAAGARFVSNRSADAGTGAEHAPERRSPTRRVSVRGPNARLFEAVRAFHEPPLFRPPQAGARFVPNRSADAGTGAEPTQRRGLAERCELGQLALRRQGRFRAGGQVTKEQGTFHEPPGAPVSDPARWCQAAGSSRVGDRRSNRAVHGRWAGLTEQGTFHELGSIQRPTLKGKRRLQKLTKGTKVGKSGPKA